MKTRCFDHIDLRVTNMETAGKFYGKFLPQLGFVHESPGDDYYTFYAGGGERPLEFFCLSEDKNHRPNGTRIAFWADTREEVDQISKLVRDAGGKTLRVRKFARTTVRVTTPSFSRILMATNSKFAAARSRYLRINLYRHPWRLRPSRFCKRHVLPLHLGSGRFKNEEPGASRTCHFAGGTPCSVSQADRAFQNRQRRAVAGGRCLPAFFEHAGSLDGCAVQLDRG